MSGLAHASVQRPAEAPPSVIDRILDGSDALSRVVALLAAVMIGGIAVLILSEVALRSLFNVSLPYAWEYSSYLNGMAVFCGAAFTLRYGGHVRVQLLVGFLGERGQRVVEIVATLLGLLVAVYITYGLTHLAIDSALKWRTSPTYNKVPLIYPQGMIAFGAILLCLQIALRLVRLLSNRPADIVSTDYTVE
jgi:TRAP-type C4-dicarboxylate transport system permease small subunit